MGDVPVVFDVPIADVADANTPDASIKKDAARPVWPDSPAFDVSFGEVSSLLKWFCVGNASKIWLNGTTYTTPVTTKVTDPQLSCCMSYAARLHSHEGLGDDVEVVLRFRGSPRVGTYDLAGSPEVLTRRARSGSVKPDGGAPTESPLTGAVVVGAGLGLG